MQNDRQRVALVTGGAKRVGRAVVQTLAARGFRVAFTYNSSAEQARQLASEFGADGLAIQADLFHPDQAVADILAAFAPFAQRLDLLVNSASAYEPSNLSQTDSAQIQRLMAIHYQAPLLLAQQFAPMLRASRGHIINMVDLLAERPWPAYLAYCGSKAALWNLTLGLARELAPEVTVNGIAPGVVEWPNDYPESERAKYLQRVPLGRAGTPEDVANLIHFLASEGAYITAQIIRLDGGRSVT